MLPGIEYPPTQLYLLLTATLAGFSIAISAKKLDRNLSLIGFFTFVAAWVHLVWRIISDVLISTYLLIELIISSVGMHLLVLSLGLYFFVAFAVNVTEDFSKQQEPKKTDSLP